MTHRRRAVPALLLAVPLLTACTGDHPPDGTVPLLPGTPYELLTEAAVLGPPPSDDPNRLTTGWRPGRGSGPGDPPGAFRTAGAAVGVAIVTLTGEARRLELDLSPGKQTDAALTAGGHAEVRIDGRPAGVAPVADPLAVDIPAGLAPGRHRVELALPGGGRHPLEVRAVRVRPADERGGDEIGDRSIGQRGPSVLDFYARPGDGAVLTGTLCPTALLRSTAGLSATLTGADDVEVDAWAGGGELDGPFDRRFDRLRGCRRWELGPVPDDGPVRVRLAAGPGAGGAWRGLGWLGGGAPAAGGRAALLPPAPRIPPPKLLVLYLPDALRADAVGHLGGGRSGGDRDPGGNPTPVLDRLAAEGHAFREHRTAAPNTLLSVRQLFTGRPVVDDDAWDALRPGVTTLAESLRDAGWRTGLFSGNSYLSERFGLARGFGHVSEEALYRGPPPETGERQASAAGWVNRNAERVHRAALDWLDSLGSIEEGAPVFLHLQTIHPHGPYAPPADLERRFAPASPTSSTAGSRITGANRTLIDLARGRRRASPADRERLRGLYRAGLAYSDRELGRFLAALAERVPPEETVVVVTSDHGEELFDHGGVLHGYTLYEELLRVPLVIWGPGRVPAGATDRVSDTYDLHATLLGLAGLDAAPGDDAPELHFAAADGPPGGAFAVRWGRWKHVWVRGTPGGWAIGQGPARSWRREYLFDLETDPGETENLAGGDGVIEGWLRTTLRAWVEARRAESRGGERPEGEPPALSPEERERLRALGYVD